MAPARFAPLPRLVALVLAIAIAPAACARTARMPTPGEREPDKYLYDRGTTALQERSWTEARLYFQQLVDQFPQSAFRQDARLGIGDSFIGEGGYDSLIIAAEKFREFLRFFPFNERADYAQYRIAVAESEQMLAPERDQTSTLSTLKEIDAFLERYPNSKYMPDVLKLQRDARTRLSDSEFRVAQFYFRGNWPAGVTARLEKLLSADPEYPRRDAVYYHLAETYYRTGRQKDALPLFSKLVEEFKVSEYLEPARARIAELTR